jgi:hypothetical protein
VLFSWWASVNLLFSANTVTGKSAHSQAAQLEWDKKLNYNEYLMES